MNPLPKGHRTSAILRRSLIASVAPILALFTVSSGSAATRCVQIEQEGRGTRAIATAPGGNIHLRFRHSIYGSQVEEVFIVRDNGFELTQLRYGEARLADFYGHENTTHDNGVWIVTPAPTLLPSLNLRLSADAAMGLLVDGRADGSEVRLQPGSAHRLTIALCKIDHHG